MAKSGGKTESVPYVAFLRAINVGGHRIDMMRLCRHFTDLGFTDVTTLLASGNVMFRAASAEEKELEHRIATELQARLGYEVATFLRTPRQLRDVVSKASSIPGFSGLAKPATLCVGFLHAPLKPGIRNKVLDLCTESDEVTVNGREIYWLFRRGISKSEVPVGMLEKTMQAPTTMRSITTVDRLVDKLARESE